MTRPCGVVSLLTDFGHRDPYVGVMKGAMLRCSPRITLLDLCHEIPPQAVDEAGFWIERCYRWFPKGTVHLVVVDPGVGSERRAIAVDVDDHFFVAPDNGVLDRVRRVAGRSAAHLIDASRVASGPLSSTFHGRDLFGPAAARLAAGELPLAELGAACRFDPLPPRPQLAPGVGQLAAEVVTVDHFGNLITDTPGPADGSDWTAEVCGRKLPFRRTYADVPEGELLVLVGSFDTIEVACNGGSASARLNAGRGTVVSLERH